MPRMVRGRSAFTLGSVTDRKVTLGARVALSLAAFFVGGWSLILIYALVRMQHLPPEFTAFSLLGHAARFYICQTVLSILGLFVLVAGLVWQNRFSTVHWSILGLLLGGISGGTAYSVRRILSYYSDFYHIEFGHGAFNQCTSEWRILSQMSSPTLGVLAVALVLIPVFVHYWSRLVGPTSR